MAEAESATTAGDAAPPVDAAAQAAASTGASALNQQLLDSVLQAAAAAGGDELGRAGAEQLTVLALGLAMQNAVAQQQQLYMLQNAASTALVKAMLDSGGQGASHWSEALALVREAFSTAPIEATLARLEQLLARATRPAAAAEPDAPPVPNPAA